jgi:hypothetical protein
MQTTHRHPTPLFLLLIALLSFGQLSANEQIYNVDSLSVDGDASSDGGRIVIAATLGGQSEDKKQPALIYSLHAETELTLTDSQLTQHTSLFTSLKHGELEQIELDLSGDLVIESVHGKDIKCWRLEHPSADNEGGLRLIVELNEPLKEGSVECRVVARKRDLKLPSSLRPLFFTPPDAGLLTGSLKIPANETLRLEVNSAIKLHEVEAATDDSHAYTYVGGGQSLALRVASKLRPNYLVEDFALTGTRTEGRFQFALDATLEVINAGDYQIPLLSGSAAFSQVPTIEGAEIVFKNNQYFLQVQKPGSYPLQLKFDAKVDSRAGRSSVQFKIMHAPLQPVQLSHIPVDATRVHLNGVAMHARGSDLRGHLEGDGDFSLVWTDPSWKRPELADAALFYSVGSITQLSVGPGLIRQISEFDVDVMQGSMSELVFDLEGQGAITQVEGDSILSWQVVGQQLVLKLNKAYDDSFLIRIQSQHTMGAFPTHVQPLKILPKDAIRYNGFIRIENSGAVTIDVPQAMGLAQISPDHFPTQEPTLKGSSQILAYRFSNVNYDYTVQADNILPEVALSQLLIYHVGLEDQSLHAEMELIIREAPLRDFYLEIPKDYALSDIEAPYLADYFVLENSDHTRQLRIVFAQPVSGRQTIRLQLENNRILNTGAWSIPPLRALHVKSTRGHIGVSVDPGLRISSQSLAGISEQATSFFPQEVSNLQLAFRMRDTEWSAGLKIVQLPQAIQVDALHLYSVGEGRTYGSSVLNYIISGSPVSTLRIHVPESMQNLDFSGRDVRGWSSIGNNIYEIQLHTPASGAYTLLATYESQFETQGAQVAFSGVEPLGIASEQGYVIVVSNFPFALNDINHTAGLLRLEPNEIPAEFRLLYDSKVLAAFQYTARPMQVQIELNAFAQADAIDQVIDYAELQTHISSDGQVLTNVNLMLKSKGQTHFRIQIPEGHEIWTARVGSKKVSPVAVDQSVLLPLPAGLDPNRAVRVQVEFAATVEAPEAPVIYAPALFAPSLVVNWAITCDPGYGLHYQSGDIVAENLNSKVTGLTWLRSVLTGNSPTQRSIFIVLLISGTLSIVIARALFTQPFKLRSLWIRTLQITLLFVSLVGLTATTLALTEITPEVAAFQDSIELRTPIELSAQPLSLHLLNRQDKDTQGIRHALWPLCFAVGLWIYAFINQAQRKHLTAAGWLCVFITTLLISEGSELFLLSLAAFFAVNVIRPLSTRCLLALQKHALWIIGLMAAMSCAVQRSEAKSIARPNPYDDVIAQQITQEVNVQDNTAIVEANLLWSTEAGQSYTFLMAPASLTAIGDLADGVRLSQYQNNAGQICYQLEADNAGNHSLNFQYRIPVHEDSTGKTRMQLPTGWSLSNQSRIQIDDTNLSLTSPQAVTVQTLASSDTYSKYALTLRPSSRIEISWQPERRDSSREAAVYHAESFDLFTPLSGLVRGFHHYRLRLAQGQLDSLTLKIPAEMTITAVKAQHMVNWQFEPEQRELRLYFQPVQMAEFDLSVESQYTSTTLPSQSRVESPRVIGAASQLGLVALATDTEVQIGEVNVVNATNINLEDFPAAYTEQLAHLGRVPSIRRAYRWSSESGLLEVQALPVKPDVRVTTEQTISLGEDRMLIKAALQAEVNRAGVFKLSMPIPADFDVETVSSEQLSHWNESVNATGTRLLQLHLKSKTTGTVALNVSLSGPGLGEQTMLVPPLLFIDGASRSTGTLALIPELGYRLNPTERMSAMQLDPAEIGMSRRKMLLFRILNKAAHLQFDVDRVEPWIEVDGVQSAEIRSGMVEVKARLTLLVENAGIREQRFRLPTNVIGVQFSGDTVADYKELTPGVWLVKLNQKMVGTFTLDLLYQIPTPDQPDELQLRGIEAIDVNQQSGYLTLVPRGRIQLEPKAQDAIMQKAEAQMISSQLRGDLNVADASHVYRLLQTNFELRLAVKRHEIAELVPAQVRDVQLASVISGKGEMLTKVTLKLDPGDKRMLRIRLPAKSEFWFGFVNQQSTWPWREGNDVLLQLEADALPENDITVEFFYSTQSVLGEHHQLSASLRGPKLDLPLENISWTLHYPQTWDIHTWDGNMTQDHLAIRAASWSDLSSYIRAEEKSRKLQKRKAESMLDEANELLGQGRQQAARQAFSNAYNLSQFDAALNEDARVQLKNVREEQALIALANRRNAFYNDNASTQTARQQVAIDESQLLNYTQRMVQDVLSGNSEEDNQALRTLATRLIDQQQAVPIRPQAIQSVLPEQGNVASFSRSLQINDQADLVIELKGTRTTETSTGGNLMVLLLLIALVYGGWYASQPQQIRS